MQCPPHCELKKVQLLPAYFHLLPTFRIAKLFYHRPPIDSLLPHRPPSS
ncbi:hypothetical protein T03_16535 [Trichinella britovi]|uniref:Uncharacterized protein n=1 Tax=Trichinella britovi TaxID=45882 RepID=A0A0V0Z6J3_TRIBR|nr:hypothetical protein T03_16535 [Trichinella britovi]